MGRKAVWIVGGAALIVISWWWIASTLMQQVVTDWAAAQRALGWQVEISQNDKTGFPFHLGADLREISLRHPETAQQIAVPRIRLTAPIFLPADIDVDLPTPPLSYSASPGTFALGFEDAQTGLRLAHIPALPLDTLHAAGKRMTLSFEGDPIATLEHATVRAQRTDAPATYAVTAEAHDLVPAARIRSALNLPEGVDRLTLTGTLSFDRPWDRSVLVQRSPLPQRIHIDNAEAVWGAVSLNVNADLEVGTDGHVSGDIRVAARGWRTMLTLAARAGTIDAEQESQLEAVLDAVSGGRETLDVPITVERGRLRIGFLPLGRLPRVFVPYLQ